MDSSLELRVGIDKGQIFSETEILDKLQNSELVKELTAYMPAKPLAIVWRLICLSEIPFSYKLDYTQKLIEKVYTKLSTPFGFSLSGDEKMFLPCYNAMIISALCRLGRVNDKQVRNAVEWINSNQPMERDKKVLLPNFNFERYGGCFKKTPCYIGLAKSVFSLQDFKEQTNDNRYDNQLEKGILYLLEHRFYKRLSIDEPINKHITDIAFPESYHLNAIELLRFAKKAKLLENEKTIDLIELVKKRQTKDKKWKNNYKYKADGYVTFDKNSNSCEWTTHIITEILNDKQNCH